MNPAELQRTAFIRVPSAAALALLFLGLSTNNQVDTALLWSPMAVLPSQQPAPVAAVAKDPAFQKMASARAPLVASVPETPLPVAVTQKDNTLIDGIHILSAKDIELYRTAFAAQEKADWKTADDALAQVKDKRLIGHVWADRYLRRDVTLDEGQQWMASYADLPEAAALYEQLRHQHGFAAAHIAQPVETAAWTGANDFGGSFGFRAQADSDEAAQKNHVAAKVAAALHRGDPLGARDLLAAEMQHGGISTPDANQLIGHIAAAFFYAGQIDRAQPLAHMAAGAGVPLGLWIDGLSAWKKQDFTLATRSFSSLAQAPSLSSWDRAAAAYWAYRAAKHINDKTQSRHWLAEAEKYPHSFYGYIAASVAGHRPSRSWKMPELTAHHIQILAQHPAGWQALALIEVGRNDLAESELRRLNPAGQRDLQIATLALAEKVRMPSLSVQIGGVANMSGQLYEAAFYPLPPWQPASGFKVDRALIFALMKRESQFDPEAVSQSGACGLMQIMPETAHLMGNQKPVNGECSDQLFDPATNIELGQKYVRSLASQPAIGNNLMLLVASYNGGPGNVIHWLEGEDHSDPLLFLESIPMHETHDYVQQVFMHYWMYKSRLAEPENSVAQLAHGEWPRYVLDTGVSKLRQEASAHGVEEVASK